MADRKGGFPHSEITGSKGARASPVLIAACHVLHRLSTPRHPLEALIHLIVLSKTHARGGLTPRHALCISQTMMSSIRSALANACAYGLTLHSRCQSRTPKAWKLSTTAILHPIARMACRAEARGSLVRLRPLGFGGTAFSRFASEGWWSQTGSNRRPHACKARALPTELWPQ